jgi:hypothetical protein
LGVQNLILFLEHGLLEKYIKISGGLFLNTPCWYNLVWNYHGGSVNPRNQSFIVTLLLIVAVVAMVVTAIQRESNVTDPLRSTKWRAIRQRGAGRRKTAAVCV